MFLKLFFPSAPLHNKIFFLKLHQKMVSMDGISWNTLVRRIGGTQLKHLIFQWQQLANKY